MGGNLGDITKVPQMGQEQGANRAQMRRKPCSKPNANLVTNGTPSQFASKISRKIGHLCRRPVCGPVCSLFNDDLRLGLRSIYTFSVFSCFRRRVSSGVKGEKREVRKGFRLRLGRLCYSLGCLPVRGLRCCICRERST